MPHVPLSEEQFVNLSLDERMQYLVAAFADLRRKLEATRQERADIAEARLLKGINALH